MNSIINKKINYLSKFTYVISCKYAINLITKLKNIIEDKDENFNIHIWDDKITQYIIGINYKNKKFKISKKPFEKNDIVEIGIDDLCIIKNYKKSSIFKKSNLPTTQISYNQCSNSCTCPKSSKKTPKK